MTGSSWPFQSKLQVLGEQNQEQQTAAQATDRSFPLTQALQKASAIPGTESAVILRDFQVLL